jgi:hypothetical protein
LGLVYGIEKFETIIFAQKGDKRRQAERKEAVAAKIMKTEHLFFEQETNSANRTPKNEDYPVEVERGDLDGETCERKDEVERLYQNDNNVQFRNMIRSVQIIECEDVDGEKTDAVMRLYGNKNNVQFRNMVQKVHEVLVVDKPIEELIHQINDFTEAISFHCKANVTNK